MNLSNSNRYKIFYQCFTVAPARFFFEGGGEKENTHVTYMMHNCPFLFLFSNCTNDHNLEHIGGAVAPPPLLAPLMFHSFTYNTEGPWHSGINVCYIKYIGIPELRYTYTYIYMSIILVWQNTSITAWLKAVHIFLLTGSQVCSAHVLCWVSDVNNTQI